MPHQYPIFEAAITGRIALEGSWEGTEEESVHRASSIKDMVPQTEEEKDLIRNAVRQEGLLLSLLDVLRRVPRRVLMVLKLNDLTRYGKYMSFPYHVLMLTTGVWIML
jgi:aarF domain-containing kinase